MVIYVNFADIYRKRKNRRRVRLTENQLHKLIKESVSTILEASMNTWNHAAERAFWSRQI